MFGTSSPSVPKSNSTHGVFIRSASDGAGSLPTACDRAHRPRPDSMDRVQPRSHSRQTQRTVEYDVLAANIRVHFRYGHTLGRFDYLALRLVHAVLSITAHSSGLTSNRRLLFFAASPTYTLDYRNGDPLIRYHTEFA